MESNLSSPNLTEDWNSSVVGPSEEEVHRSSFTWNNVILVTTLSIVIAVTMVGNTLVIAAVLTTRRLRTVTNCFVMSLAVADWLVGLFVMPPAIAYQVMGSWELGWVLCDIWVSLDVLLCTASILSLGAISIDRYLAVTQPLIYSRRRRSKRLALAMILAVWLAAAAITCPPIFGWYEHGRHENKTCRYNRNVGYVVFSAMGSFFLPLVVMLYVYARISCVIARRLDPLAAAARTEIPVERAPSSSDNHEHRGASACNTPQLQRLHSCCSNQHEVRTLSRHAAAQGLQSHSSRVSSFRRESKTAQTLLLVVGGFVACWLPFFLLYIITPFLPTAPSPDLQSYFTWLGWINSAINPFIYAFYSADFRVAFWRLTCQRFSKSPRPFAPAVADPLYHHSEHSSVRRKQALLVT
ncbi:tyramine receptor 1-like isoform X2 [Neocloeon triangulifer]|uniref:tyramine receptor 1-like isoform X2 n=1 Tax=Neocloeon triangulifer TaxID=2078957 RepID=UPI00286F1132|nr:tyramine receptor 1-like isoform X2 [Neocloeon triangulifer]